MKIAPALIFLLSLADRAWATAARPGLVPLPEIHTSPWAIVLPIVCLGLLAWNVTWRRRG